MRPLSKSALQLGAQCPRLLWFKYHMPRSCNPVSQDESANEQFEIGNLVGAAARHYFDDEPGYCLTIDTDRGFSPEYYREYAIQTMEAMDDLECHTIAEATFYVDDIVVFVDLLHRNPYGGWDIYEVKSSRQAKPVHARDCAWQTYVVRTLCGVDIRDSYLMVPARGTTRFYDDGECAKDVFIVVDDWSNWIYEQSVGSEIPASIAGFWDMLSNPDAPPLLPDDVSDIGDSTRCRSPYQCQFSGICRECALAESEWNY